MKKTPLELFLSDEVQALLDDFAALLDIRVTFFSIAGDCLRRGKAMRNCEYCRIVQTELGNWERCVSMDNDKRNEVLSGGRTITYRTTVTNHYRWANAYELPETGGTGIPLYILCGLFLVLAPLVYGIRLRREYERRSRE